MSGKLIFRQMLILCLAFCITASGQDSSFNKLRPQHYMLQYAGGIGFFSAGIGYSNKKDWLEGDLYYGYVPKSIGGVTIHAFSGKLGLTPFSFSKGQYRIKPVTSGIIISYTPGKQYFGFSPDNYPFDYYGFPTSFHAGIFLGGQIMQSKQIEKKNQLGLYYELISFDRQLISFINNFKALKIADIINIGIGIKMSFK